MSNYNQNQATIPRPTAATAYPAEPQGGYMAPPPPPGYPTKDVHHDGTQTASSLTIQSRAGDDSIWWLDCCAPCCRCISLCCDKCQGCCAS